MMLYSCYYCCYFCVICLFICTFWCYICYFIFCWKIFCQNCTIGLTRKDYERFFGVGHGEINWNEKGDWDDVFKLDTDPVNFSDYFEKVKK